MLASVIPGHCVALHVNRSCWPVLPLGTVWSYMSTGHAGQCYPWALCGVTCQPVMLASVTPGYCVELHVNRSCWPVLSLGTVWRYMSTGHAGQCYPWVLCGVTCQPVMLASVIPGHCVELGPCTHTYMHTHTHQMKCLPASLPALSRPAEGRVCALMKRGITIILFSSDPMILFSVTKPTLALLARCPSPPSTYLDKELRHLDYAPLLGLPSPFLKHDSPRYQETPPTLNPTHSPGQCFQCSEKRFREWFICTLHKCCACKYHIRGT